MIPVPQGLALIFAAIRQHTLLESTSSIPQLSPEWFSKRRAMITASEAASFLPLDPSVTDIYNELYYPSTPSSPIPTDDPDAELNLPLTSTPLNSLKPELTPTIPPSFIQKLPPWRIPIAKKNSKSKEATCNPYATTKFTIKRKVEGDLSPQVPFRSAYALRWGLRYEGVTRDYYGRQLSKLHSLSPFISPITSLKDFLQDVAVYGDIQSFAKVIIQYYQNIKENPLNETTITTNTASSSSLLEPSEEVDDEDNEYVKIGSNEWLSWAYSSSLNIDVLYELLKSPIFQKIIPKIIMNPPPSLHPFLSTRSELDLTLHTPGLISFPPISPNITTNNSNNIASFASSSSSPLDLPQMGASPDGLVTPSGALLEIKCPPNPKHPLGSPPALHHWIQTQFQLAITGLEVCDFIEGRYLEFLTSEQFLENTLPIYDFIKFTSSSSSTSSSPSPPSLFPPFNTNGHELKGMYGMEKESKHGIPFYNVHLIRYSQPLQPSQFILNELSTSTPSPTSPIEEFASPPFHLSNTSTPSPKELIGWTNETLSHIFKEHHNDSQNSYKPGKSVSWISDGYYHTVRAAYWQSVGIGYTRVYRNRVWWNQVQDYFKDGWKNLVRELNRSNRSIL